MELEEELKVVGNSLKSLEVSEEKANQRVEEFKKQLKSLTVKLKEAEARAEFAEKTVKKLQKEVDRLEGNLFDFCKCSASLTCKCRLFSKNIASKLYFPLQHFLRLCFSLLNLCQPFCFQTSCSEKRTNISASSPKSTRLLSRCPRLAKRNECFVPNTFARYSFAISYLGVQSSTVQ